VRLRNILSPVSRFWASPSHNLFNPQNSVGPFRPLLIGREIMVLKITWSANFMSAKNQMHTRTDTSLKSLTAHSIPIDAPLHGPPPARFSDGELLAIQYQTDPAAISELLPAPLEALNDVVMVQLARWGDVPGMGRDTFEANIMIAARFDSPVTTIIGAYSPYFYVDNDRAMAGGREFHAMPNVSPPSRWNRAATFLSLK